MKITTDDKMLIKALSKLIGVFDIPALKISNGALIGFNAKTYFKMMLFVMFAG